MQADHRGIRDHGDVATFTDKFGEERVVHRTRHGLKVKRTTKTPVLQMNPVVAGMIGARIRELRKERGWTLKELAIRSGMESGWPKDRMWAIENATRKEGMRLGTIYAIAMALGVEVTDLMPPVADVRRAAGVREITVPSLESPS